MLVDTRGVLYVGHQPRRARAYCQISIAGQDVTSRFDPFLIGVVIEDPEDGMSKASIELDDRYGRINMPEGTAPIDILLGWPEEGSFRTFSGLVSDIESYGQKKTGRMMKIEASGADVFQSGKAMLRMHFGDGSEDMSIGTILEKAGQSQGYSVVVDPDIAQNKRKYVIAHNESFPAFAKRISDEVGGTLSIDGKTATIGSAAAFNPAAGSGGAILFETGKNLIAWRIKPQVARPAWGSVSHIHFDPDKAKHLSTRNTIDAGAGFAQANANYFGIFTRSSADHSQQQANADQQTSTRMRGYGWVIIDGEPRCVKNGGGTIKGVRNGVDGDYRIVSVTHLYSRAGFTTRCEVNSPGANFGASKGFTKQ